jgi:glycosyltransferase involved in cell wall biosynthesis
MADSQSTKNDLIDLLNIKETKIKVAYLGVDESYFAEYSVDDLAEIKTRYGLPDDYLFFVGTIEPRKNLASIIGALDKLGWPVDLVIAGSYGWKSQQVKKLIESNNKIHYLGYVNEADKPALYRLAKGLIYPSYYEGFGLPIIEAMASGCPVIAGNDSSQGEVLGDCGILVDPYNITSIRQGINVILNDQEMKDVFIANGTIRAKEFSWNKTAQITLDAISSLK